MSKELWPQAYEWNVEVRGKTDPESMEDMLNRLAGEGWEFVRTEMWVETDTEYAAMYFFFRRVRAEATR